MSDSKKTRKATSALEKKLEALTRGKPSKKLSKNLEDNSWYPGLIRALAER